MNHQTLTDQLKRLKLLTAAAELESVLDKRKAAAEVTWAVELLERELDARREKRLKARIKSARFPEVTSLENFDWTFNPEIDELKIKELAKLNFVKENQIGLFLENRAREKHIWRSRLASAPQARASGFTARASSVSCTTSAWQS